MRPHPIIAIETSGRRGSVALAEGAVLVEEAAFPADRDHARDLIPTIDALARRHGVSPDEIDQCHISIGPGSFTGLRVAVTFARHLALAVGVHICCVPTLDVIAENCVALEAPPEHLAVLLDAKRGQVFASIYRHDGGAYRRMMDPTLIEPTRLLADAPSPVSVVGEGIDYHAEAVRDSGAGVLDRVLWRPKAANVHRLGWGMALRGEFTQPSELTPFYLRRPEAEESWEKRQGANE
ncbi:MAG: tRNA (adenosine(37)-N6)-threonylcarbamoyltransferase complex dimerization subunit type 1 TsaB [Phycisphaerae bacterium]